MALTRRGRFEKSGSRPGRQITRPAPVWIVIAAILLTATFLLYYPVSRKFVVIEEKTGKILYCATVKPGDIFSVRYIHSVNKSPVEDTFEIREDYGIILRKTVFLSFGAGIPFELDAGQVLRQTEQGIEIGNINRNMDEFLLRVGTIADHTLCMHGREIRLDRLTKPQQAVRFDVRRIPAASAFIN